MGKVIKKALGGVNKLTGGVLGGITDNFLGQDIGGFKEAQKQAQEQEAQRNQAVLNQQLNANTIGAQGVDNIVSLEAGGTATDSASGTGIKKRRGTSISSTLGI